MKPFNQHLPIVAQSTADFYQMIIQSITNFDVIVFPAGGPKEVVATKAHPLDVAASLESHERAFEYGDPVIYKAMEPSQEILAFGALSSGDDLGDIGQDEAQSLLIAGTVPKRSVVGYLTTQADGSNVLKLLYLVGSDGIGTKTPIGYKHRFMPFVGGDLLMTGGELDFASVLAQVRALLETVEIPESG